MGSEMCIRDSSRRPWWPPRPTATRGVFATLFRVSERSVPGSAAAAGGCGQCRRDGGSPGLGASSSTRARRVGRTSSRSGLRQSVEKRQPPVAPGRSMVSAATGSCGLKRQSMPPPRRRDSLPRARKRFGQHFLVDNQALEAIAMLATQDIEQDRVVEICLLYTSPSPRDS